MPLRCAIWGCSATACTIRYGGALCQAHYDQALDWDWGEADPTFAELEQAIFEAEEEEIQKVAASSKTGGL